MPTFKFDGLSRLTHTGTVELKTARLTLRRFCAEDAASAFRNFTGRPETTEFLAWEPHRALPEAEAWVSNWAGKYGDPAFYRWAIVFEGEVIGSIHLIEPHDRALACELGYYIGPAHWGRGIATEAGLAVRDHVFSRLGMNKIRAWHYADNAASGAVLKKLGMTIEGVLRQETRLWGGRFSDVITYGILASEWRAIPKI